MPLACAKTPVDAKLVHLVDEDYEIYSLVPKETASCMIDFQHISASVITRRTSKYACTSGSSLQHPTE